MKHCQNRLQVERERERGGDKRVNSSQVEAGTCTSGVSISTQEVSVGRSLIRHQKKSGGVGDRLQYELQAV